MQKRLMRLLGLAYAAWLATCTVVAGPSPPPDGNEAARTVYVVGNGWHTGIVLAREDLLPGRLPEAADFPKATFLEFGWGDRDYYPAPRPTFAMALEAALTPTPAVMHLAGFHQPPQHSYPEAEVLSVALTTAELDRMIAGIDADFERPLGGRATAIGPGLYPDSRFYRARGRFHLFNTCNTWTAHKLATAGLALSSNGVITAGDLMRRLRALPAVTGTGGNPNRGAYQPRRRQREP
ncbi:MAG: DUF2459 domain-containing protein [Dongiaceae bacterium]